MDWCIQFAEKCHTVSNVLKADVACIMDLEISSLR